MDKLNNLYEWILESLRLLEPSREDEETFKKYLQSLKPYVKALRESYQNDRVTVDYKNPNTQVAYLLVYYPFYVEMTYQVLKRLNESSSVESLFEQKHLNLCLFGAGAAPEAIGLLSFIEDFYPGVKSLVIRSYDIYADTWRLSQNITKTVIKTHFKNRKFALLTHSLDISLSDVFMPIKEIIKNSNIFIFQNCLNEVKENNNFFKNIDYLLQMIPTNSLLIMADLRIYSKVNTIQDKIKEKIITLNKTAIEKFNQEMFCVCADQTDFTSSIPIALILKENLLTGEDRLKPRKYIKCNYLSIYKVYTEELQESNSDNYKQDYLQSYANLQERLAEFLNRQEIEQLFENQLQKIKQNINNLEQNFIDREDILKRSIEREKQTLVECLDEITNRVQRLEFNDRLIEIQKSLDQNTKLLSEEIEAKINTIWQEWQSSQYPIQENLDILLEGLEKSQINWQSAEEKIDFLENMSNIFRHDTDYLYSKSEEIRQSKVQLEEKLNKLDMTVYHFINDDRKSLTRRLERMRKIMIFSLIVGFLGVLLGGIALFW